MWRPGEPPCAAISWSLQRFSRGGFSQSLSERSGQFGKLPHLAADTGGDTFLRFETIMREYVWLECTVCGSRNYRTHKETRGADRLTLNKFCRKERKHTPHKEQRKK
jgi:large subunit ribosomal protein L33